MEDHPTLTLILTAILHQVEPLTLPGHPQDCTWTLTREQSDHQTPPLNGHQAVRQERVRY